MANNEPQDNLSKSSQENEWDLGWDEFWDQESIIVEPQQVNVEKRSNSLDPIFNKKNTRRKFENELQEAIEKEFEDEITPNLNWGIIDDTKPTNLNARLKSFISAPFSAVLEPKKSKPLKAEIDLAKLKKERKGSERPKIKIRPPKIHSTIGESNQRASRIVIEASDLSFNNLNNVTRSELNEINSLLEGSLGKKESVKFDNDIVHEKNINFAVQEKLIHKKKEEAKKDVIDKKVEQLSAEVTIASEISPADTLVPGLNDIRFDLKKAQETSNLFDQNEIDEILVRLPAEKFKNKTEKVKTEDQILQKSESDKIGAALFDDNKIVVNDPQKSTDDNLDSIFDEIDGEDKNNLAGSFNESLEDSTDKDEIITEKNIVDDNSEAALEFMDSAAMEAESLFEDFFKQGTSDNEKEVDKKITYLDIIKIKIKEIKSAYKLCVRFAKDPKYIMEYFKITAKDIYVAVGVIFLIITYTGFINLQFITEKFPMNLF